MKTIASSEDPMDSASSAPGIPARAAALLIALLILVIV
jgi:hypothetical protein